VQHVSETVPADSNKNISRKERKGFAKRQRISIICEECHGITEGSEKKYVLLKQLLIHNLSLLMSLILPVENKFPEFGSNCFIAPNATIVGDVIMGDDCSIWFNAVVRGDVNFIKMGNKVNVQDGACIHCTYQKFGTTIGNNVSIGHNAIVHGCTVYDDVLIGMGAIVMDGAVVNSNTIIAAGAVVLEGTICEAGSIYAGVPAKKVKDIDPEKIHGEINRIADNYVRYSDWFRKPQPDLPQ
jgi:carbonic anhydrase/acetyltransferase-like protein (isoleucine patch superfamily)